MNSKSVRKAFLDFFARNGHEIVRSSPLVLANDPTLLFANAGMNQFKDVFTGKEIRPCRRATSSQKCVRAGGKHNDLENVGFTARHHTFFEMLGNFSFGDYFKSDAIAWAYQLLVKELGLDPGRMMFTVFGGDASLAGVPADDEARELWRKVAGVSNDQVMGLSAKDNFWQMGDVGPMGPCSEIHFHQGDDIPCPEPTCKGPACDCDRWLEIWNLVFMQYERKEKDGPLGRLPAPSVDTGAGLERMTAVIQGKRSNYDTDLFQPLLAMTSNLAKRRYGQDPRDDASMRVIADHARATAFLVADGVFPDKTGREYVLRRIFRRAVRHGKRLGIEEPFMHVACGAVIEQMGDVYPELVERRKVIEQVSLEEEIRFRKTLDRGLRLLEEEFERMERQGEKIVPGEKVFQLYDTYGFPADLTAVIAAERGLGVDTTGFEREMKAAQERSEFKGQDEAVADVYKQLASSLPATAFLGYEGMGTFGKGTIRAILVNGTRTSSAEAGQRVAITCDRTPFYGASGGQIGDTGEITSHGGRMRVTDTIKPVGDMIVHLGEVVSGEVHEGDEVELQVDFDRREMIRANHSATHLLHLALKKVLGDHAVQKGSLVTADRLRFDFSHFAPLTKEQERKVEDLVNAEIRRNLDSATDVLSMEEAKKRGAVHMFGEKYGNTVRVVRIGGESLEFCGGTHVRRTGDIGFFKIVSETGIAQGVRRIEAVTGVGAIEYLRRLDEELAAAAEKLKGTPFEVATRVEKLLQELRGRDKEIATLKQKLLAGGARDILSDVKNVGGVQVLATKTEVADPKALREMGDKLRDRLGSGVIVLLGVGEGKVSILSMVTKDLTDRFHAGKIATALAEIVGGRGGGRPDMAQAGGTDPSKADQAVAKVVELVGG
ncbi:MAG: alanine--tRNA ligase [Deltaproteobacteria bacterium]|nr:alanine--tRNA ligase [Deltaproteobacteria bacterium]